MAAIADALEYAEYVCPAMLTKSDYAAQAETPRVFWATCGSREKHNCCISVPRLVVYVCVFARKGMEVG